jgi:hypothetical protein
LFFTISGSSLCFPRVESRTRMKTPNDLAHICY